MTNFTFQKFLKIWFLVFFQKKWVPLWFQRTVWYQKFRLTLGNILDRVLVAKYAIIINKFLQNIFKNPKKMHFADSAT